MKNTAKTSGSECCKSPVWLINIIIGNVQIDSMPDVLNLGADKYVELYFKALVESRKVDESAYYRSAGSMEPALLISLLVKLCIEFRYASNEICGFLEEIYSGSDSKMKYFSMRDIKKDISTLKGYC